MSDAEAGTDGGDEGGGGGCRETVMRLRDWEEEAGARRECARRGTIKMGMYSTGPLRSADGVLVGLKRIARLRDCGIADLHYRGRTTERIDIAFRLQKDFSTYFTYS